MGVKSRWSEAKRTRPFRRLHNWQRFPSQFVTEGWLAKSSAGGAVNGCLHHGSLSTLLALYAQLFGHNLQVSPTMEGNELEVDVAGLAGLTGRPKEKVERTLRLLQQRGFLSRKGETLSLLDPTTGEWPPRPFAMLPAPYLMARLPKIRGYARKDGIQTQDVLSLYVVLVVQRNHTTEEIWFSREKSAQLAGLEPEQAVQCLAVLMKSAVVARSGLSTFKYSLVGLEPTDGAVEIKQTRRAGRGSKDA